MEKTILEFVLESHYRLRFDTTGETFPHYELPIKLGYQDSGDIFLEYDELIPLSDDRFTLVYSVHDLKEKSSETYNVTGRYDATEDVFVVENCTEITHD